MNKERRHTDTMAMAMLDANSQPSDEDMYAKICRPWNGVATDSYSVELSFVAPLSKLSHNTV